MILTLPLLALAAGVVSAASHLVGKQLHNK